MSEPTATLSEYFTLDHRSCDAQWADVEAAADAENAEDIRAAWDRFDAALRRHLDREEEILFPAFEAATGMRDGGPTFVMRSEHAQMRGLLEQMAVAVEGADYEELLDLGDTLLMLIQQHNQKEEHMLYPLSERALGPQWNELRKRLDDYPGAG